MTEPTTADAFDLDAWLDGAKRTERAVTLYARPDLLADIDRLEAQLRAIKAVPEEDQDLSAGKDERRITAAIDALYVQLDQSKLEFRVSVIDDEEQEEIVSAVKSDLKDEADAAAAKARGEAREQCARADIKAVNDINQMVRLMSIQAAENVFTREVNIRKIAKAVVSPQMTADQVRKLYRVVGEAQIELLSRAFTRAMNEAPQVAVPKSLKPSPSDDGLTSS